MARIESPTEPSVMAEIDPVMSALRVTPRPMQAIGYYQVAVGSGVMTAVAAGLDLAAMRWVDPEYLMLIHYLKLRMVQVTAGAASVEVGMSVDTAYDYTAHAGGQLAMNASVTNWLKRSSFPQSRLPTITYANTGGLAAGNRNLGSSYMLGYNYAPASTTGTVLEMVMDLTNNPLSYPLVLRANEGLAVRNLVTFAASAAWRFTLEMAWAECSPDQFPSF